METKFKRGDRVLVRDANASWKERIYLTTIDGMKGPYICVMECNERSFKENKSFGIIGWEEIKQLGNEVESWEDLGYAHPEWVTLEQEIANTAMKKLSQLMKDVNGDWIPDWTDDRTEKQVIYFYDNKIIISFTEKYHHFLSFPTEEIRNNFLESHRELIMKAKPLL